MPQRILKLIHIPLPAAPLASFRILFGAAVFISTLRFLLLDWVDVHFIDTKFQFKYYGFEWVHLLPQAAMYAIHFMMLLAALGIMFGAWYRISAVLFFMCFTYCELIDLTYYLNHYYFVSIVSVLMCVLPAHRYFSIDAWRKPTIQQSSVPAWTINILKFQLICVYFFAGIAKINSDWLISALPLRIWLPANDNMPLLGALLRYDATAYLFSWAGMLFDITIGIWLIWHRTRLWAWLVVVFFHAITGWMFQIGVFPLVMIMCTLVFFGPNFHQRFLHAIRRLVPHRFNQKHSTNHAGQALHTSKFTVILLSMWVTFQVVFPLRCYAYPGNMFWSEQGYRFGWRVMLFEKAGTATFYVTDENTGKEGVVDNNDFLNPHQEKQMAMQPDMILQYAQFLKKYYEQQGLAVSRVRAEVYVTFNARPSQLLVDENVNLLDLKDSWEHKNWIKPLD
jgi:hypothetical protein